MHYISDEVGSLSVFNSPPEKPFVSALSLLGDSTAGDEGVGEVVKLERSRCHVLWSASKDFGSPGMRMVSFYFPIFD